MRRGRGYAAKRRVTFIETPPGEPLPQLTGRPLLLPEWVEAGFVPVITERDEIDAE